VSQHHFAAQPSRGFPSNLPKSVTWLETAIAKLPPDQLARFRRWFNAFEGADHAKEL
jgi:hypothetical protein